MTLADPARPGRGAIGAMSFADHLAGLDVALLTVLLEHRPDVLVEAAVRQVVDELCARGLAEREFSVAGIESVSPVG